MQKIQPGIVSYAAWSVALLCAAYAVLWLLGVFGGLGFHGTIAAVLGITLTSILAVLLMGLLFFSEHSGHDKEVHDATSNDRHRD
jgi:fatty acid desaturase